MSGGDPLIIVLRARIAELEAEVARLTEALRLKYGDTIRAAVLAEREACAQIADRIYPDNAAEAIRARSAP